jgi:hypothetical protein
MEKIPCALMQFMGVTHVKFNNEMFVEYPQKINYKLLKKGGFPLTKIFHFPEFLGLV